MANFAFARRLGVLSLLALMESVSAVHAAESGAGAPAVEQFLRDPTFRTMRISPDGSYIAATVPVVDSKTILVVLDRKTMQRTAMLAMAGRDDVAGFSWVTDQRLVVTPARQEGMLDAPVWTGELYAVDADGKRSVPLFGYRMPREGSQATNIRGPVAERASAFLLDTLRNQEHQILIKVVPWGATEGAFNEVRRLNLRSGRASRVVSAPIREAEFLTDHEGNVRFSWGETVAGKQELYVREASGGEWRKINDEAESTIRIVPRSFDRDGRRVFVVVSDTSGPSRLELLDLETGARERVAGDPVADIGVGLYGADDRLYAVIVEPDRPRLLYVDEESREARLSRALEQAFPGQFAYFTSFTSDGGHGLVHVYSDRNPGEFYLFDLASMQAAYLAATRDWIDPDQMAQMKPIRMRTDDGVDLHGYLTLPHGQGERGLPMIVVPHGGPHGVRDRWQFDADMQLLASRGYALLQVNFRGSGGYGLAFERAGHRQWAGRMQDDLAAAVRWAIDEGYADPDRICISGASYGGYAAMMNAARYPDLYRCAVGYVGVYDLRLMHSEGDVRQYLYGRAFLDRIIGNDQLHSASPVAFAERIKVPVMLVHGGEDQRVPISHAERMRRALREAGNEPEWLVERREGHGFYNMENRVKLSQQLLTFFERHIGLDAKAADRTVEQVETDGAD